MKMLRTKNKQKMLSVIIGVLAMLCFAACIGPDEQNIQEVVQDQINNRPNACRALQPGQSMLCAAADRLGLNLTDLGKAARLAVPAAFMLAYKDDQERAKAITKGRAATAEIIAFIQGEGEVTGARLYQFIQFNSTKDRVYALFIYAGMQEFFDTPEMLVPLKDWDKRELVKWFTAVNADLAFLAGTVARMQFIAVGLKGGA